MHPNLAASGAADTAEAGLPPHFAAWFADRGWQPRAHQLELLAVARAGRSALLVAPTGAGKTLAGFLPTLTELAEAGAGRGLHTLYVSPLKALAVDVARNLDVPVAQMGLAIRAEARSGDTSSYKRARQIARPPDVLLTTPEQVELLVTSREARGLFAGLRRVVIDELHALAGTKRGDLLALSLARLRAIAPGLTATGLSATVREPDDLRRWLVPQPPGGEALADLVTAGGAAPAVVEVLTGGVALPVAGHTARHAMPAVYEAIRAHRLSLVFVNTRLQAEYAFQELWRLNEEALPIGLHHGSLAAELRRRVEAAMAAGELRAVVATSTLDLGIDWGDVDLVVNLGAPKGASRLMQRIGRANHRLDEPSKALLVPANRFELLECRAALEAVARAAQDTPPPRPGALDVLAQHVLSVACSEPFDEAALHAEVRGAAPYAWVTAENFRGVVEFVATGGYALRAYDRFQRIARGKDGLWRVTNAQVARRARLNQGTILDSDRMKVRLGRLRAARPGAPAATGLASRRGGVIGEVEELFAEGLTPGDTFLFGGQVLRFEAIAEQEVIVSRAPPDADAKIPSYAGARFPISPFLAAGVRAILADPAAWGSLPPEVAGWLREQRRRSRLPGPGELLVETFPHRGRHSLVAYPFEGRLAHQTLGMLLTRRLERLRLKPLAFVANDYGLGITSMDDLGAAVRGGTLDLGALFAPDLLGDDLEEWLDESAMMKRTFRGCAVIAGLVDRRLPGEPRTGRQVTVSTDLIYDVLRRHDPHHLLLRAARADAATGLLDIRRLSDMLARIEGHVVHRPLMRLSPLGVSIVLEYGREAVYGEAADALLAEAEAELLAEAGG